jgi:uncharacterized protein YigA (DUF484 family)
MTDALNHPITEDDIANYLANTPDFFARHAELLASVQLNSPHSHRAVSLQERQAEMLRDKIRLLEHRVMDMIRHGNENALLSERLLRWAAGLLQPTDPGDLPVEIARQICAEFSVPQAAIKVWGVSAAHAAAGFAQGVSEDARLFSQSLTEPFCGANTGFEAVTWLDNPAAAASIALLPLRPPGTTVPADAFGMLVLASPDAQRYTSGMGTEFLQHLAALAGAALTRLR